MPGENTTSATLPRTLLSRLREERFAIRELRWWNLTELLGTEQRVLPRNLANLVVDLLKNGPGAVRKIDLSAHDGW